MVPNSATHHTYKSLQNVCVMMEEKSCYLLPTGQWRKIENKVIHYSHHAKLTRICIELNIIPKGLKIF